MVTRDWLTILIEVRHATSKEGVDTPKTPRTEQQSALRHPTLLGPVGRDALPNQSTSS